MALRVRLAARTREGAQHSPARPHWPAPRAHTTSHGAPVGLAQRARLPRMRVGIIPVLELVVLHYIYCTLNKRLSALPLTVSRACATIGPDLIYALSNQLQRKNKSG